MSPIVLIVVGGIAVLVIFGAGIALFAGGNQRNVDERLEQFVGSSDVVDIAEEIEVASGGADFADKMDSALSGRGFFAPTKDRISKADVKLRVSEYIIFVIMSAIGVAAAAYFLMNQSKILMVIGAVIGMQIPKIYLIIAASKRIKAFTNQLIDTLNLWVNAFLSG